MNQRGELDMARYIRNNTEIFVKLVACGIALQSAQAKLNAYMEKNVDLYLKAMDDEESLEYMMMYYYDNTQELINLAEESVTTAYEAEALVDQGEWIIDEERN
jgi:hypothetical protein